jgi:protein arginine kinase
LEPLFLYNDKVLGHLFRLSTAVGLGCSEEELLAQLESIANRICDNEQQMRNRMLEKNRIFVQDSVGRSLGVLQNCCELSFEEGVNLLSIMVMAIDDGLLPH